MHLDQRHLEEDLLSGRIYDLLYYLGATANYTGFFYVAHAIRLSISEPERLTLVTKWLYPDIAKFYSTKWQNVERNIRTVIHYIWENYPGRYCEIAGLHPEQKPSSAKFLSTLTEHLRQNQATPPQYLFRY